MTTIFIHPAVTRYLAELDEALRNSPGHDADELRDQVRTHIEDAVGPDATDQEIEATLRRLGPQATSSVTGRQRTSGSSSSKGRGHSPRG